MGGRGGMSRPLKEVAGYEGVGVTMMKDLIVSLIFYFYIFIINYLFFNMKSWQFGCHVILFILPAGQKEIIYDGERRRG